MTDTAINTQAGNGAAPSAAVGETPLVSLRGLTKRFGSVQALKGVDLDVVAGQITALAGDNGAGKSVLIKTIAGLWQPDEGEIFWEGKPVQLRSPRDAEVLGIKTIYQDLALCDNLDVVQNMYLGHEPLKHGLMDEAKMEHTSRETLEDLSVTSLKSIHQPVRSLSGGQRQSVAVARAVMRKAKLVIMDEPTAALGVTQTQMVLDLVRSLKGEGVAVILISHNLNNVFAVADRIAILHLGKLVASGPLYEFDPTSVVEYMTTGKSARSVQGAADPVLSQ
jgi:ABC-type sugar transport system ATPase subunit